MTTGNFAFAKTRYPSAQRDLRRATAGITLCRNRIGSRAFG
jgi:hypothetical protein